MQDLAPYCGLPPEAVMAEEEGLHENHEYADIRWLAEPGRVDGMLELEDMLLAYQGDTSSDEAIEEFGDNEYYCMGFDDFVGSAVLALVAVGAVPFTSCSGAPGHSESHPLVVFWCPVEILSRVRDAAASAGVELTGVTGDHPALMVSIHDDVMRLRAFARALSAE